jgi:hypothetical protein
VKCLTVPKNQPAPWPLRRGGLEVSDDLDRLLARGRLSGPQRERILDRVLEATARPGRLRLKHVIVAAPLVAAAAALVLVSRQDEAPSFSPKGDKSSTIETTCSGGLLSACPIGSKLVFRFDGVSEPAYVQAYATPSPPNAGDRIWYFPTSAVPAPQLTAHAESEVLQKGVLIGPEHSAGGYRITLVLSARPLTRDELLQEAGSHEIRRETIDLGVIGQ